MGNIKRIFLRDIKALLKNPFAFIIAGGLCIIPALYAWFNIYSNWDPYGNTGNLKIAVASEDKGYDKSDGSHVNMAESVMDEVKKNKAIDWVVTDAEDAKQGVSSGSYYAAVVFADDFSACMYHGFLEGLKRPKVTYYENEKKNAVATKITDTAVTNLENQINGTYISVVVSSLFDYEQQAVSDVQEQELLDALTKRVARAGNTVEEFSGIVRALVRANDRLEASMDEAGSELGTVKGNLETVQGALTQTPDTAALAARMEEKSNDITQALADARQELKLAVQADAGAKKQQYYGELRTTLTGAKKSVDDLADTIEAINVATVDVSQGILLTQLENQSGELNRMLGQVNKAAAAGVEAEPTQTEQALEEQLALISGDSNRMVTQAVTALGAQLTEAASDIAAVTDNLAEDAALLEMILADAGTSVAMTNESFSGMEKELSAVSEKLARVSELLAQMENVDLTKKLASFLEASPKEYGTFFAQPVKVDTKAVYPVENYGSGVAPFYTTLALWVGGIVLVSLIKVKAHTDGLDNPKPYELFFGRYLLFLLLALIQAAVTVWGNFYLLHIQCLYPRRFLLAAFVASITFSLLIYALTISFGDIGKAVVVVLVVLQIAGSSGTYPIEILPEFYRRVYIFFPFPYAINAMREAVCGLYEHDYTLYLLRLLLFAAGALALGLFIRLPFARLSHFVEKRMEDTQMM